MVIPIIATIKNIIDDKKDKKIIIRYVSKFNNNDYDYNESTAIDEEDYNLNKKFWMNYDLEI
jgi:hypothetical protein